MSLKKLTLPLSQAIDVREQLGGKKANVWRTHLDSEEFHNKKIYSSGTFTG